MHQSVATSATQGPGNSGAIDFYRLQSQTPWGGGDFLVKSPQITPVFSPLLSRVYL